MAVKVIVELKAKPGRRDELRSLIERLATAIDRAATTGARTTSRSMTPTCSSTSPTGSHRKHGRRISRRPWPPVPTVRCSSWLGPPSGPRSSAGCPEGMRPRGGGLGRLAGRRKRRNHGVRSDPVLAGTRSSSRNPITMRATSSGRASMTQWPTSGKKTLRGGFVNCRSIHAPGPGAGSGRARPTGSGRVR